LATTIIIVITIMMIPVIQTIIIVSAAGRIPKSLANILDV
jgi:hypothetical protein